MKTLHGVGLTALTFAMLGGGVWIGCRGDDAETPATIDDDAGDNADTSTGPGQDTGSPPVDANPGPKDAGRDSQVPEVVSCDNYCAKVMANCTAPVDAGAEAGPSTQQYKDLATCKVECALLPLGDAGDTSGNTIACRQYHAGLTPATTHCAHAGPYGGTQCGTSRCEPFCDLARVICDDAGRPFGLDAGTCPSQCLAFALEAGAAVSETYDGPDAGDTIYCREHYLQSAFGSAGTAKTNDCKYLKPTSTMCK